LDTLRADHLGSYGYERDTSPNIDKFAERGARFEYAVTAAPWTPPSVASIFTGLFASTHGMMPPNNRELAKNSFVTLNSELQTLAEVLKSEGYNTGAISPNPWITKEFGFDQGFDTFAVFLRADAKKITAEATEMVTELKAKGAPFFAYLHYLDPHDPYSPPPPFNEQFSGPLKSERFPYGEKTLKKIGLYDGEIRFMDEQLGGFFKFLEGQGLLDNSIVVIVGDHGEQFMERGDQGHGFRVHNEEVHVPLIISGVKGLKGVVPHTVSTIDIYPTIVEAVGSKVDYKGPGVSLTNFEGAQKRLGVLSEISRKYEQRALSAPEGDRVIVDYELSASATEAEHKKIGAGLFNRHKDYHERKPIEDPEMLRSMIQDYQDVYDTAKHGANRGARKEITSETIEQLKSLGYLQ
jgi:arylsulfatase